MPIIRPATQEEADNRLKNAFINQDFGSLGGEVESYPLPDRKALLYSSATSAWAERILGAPVNPYNPGWQGTKDGIVRNYFGEREAKDVSDEDLFGKIAADYQTLDSLKDAAKIAAYRGEASAPWARKFQEVKEQGKMPLGRARDYLQITKQVHDEYRAKIEPYRQTINTVAALATNGKDAANFDAMARELLKVPKDDRPFVIEALASQAPDVIDQGGISNAALTFGRAVERFLSKSGTGLQEMLTPAGNVSEIPLEPETPEEKANREARQKEAEDFRELRDQIRDVANGKLAPVESVRFLGMNISGAIESVPMTMAAFIPYAGPAALIGNFQRETFNELRSTNPTMTREAAQNIATISAPFQALTEVVSDRLLFGKLPSLKRAFTAPAFTAGGVAKQLAQRVAVGTTVETGEEFVQGVTPLLVQSLSTDVPGVDWQGYFDQFGENLPEMILTILPLAIVGAGTGQLSDFATGRMLATSPQHLTASGYSPEASTEIANAANSGDWAKAENLMRADWAKVNAKGKAVSEVAGQAAVRVEEARAAQAAAVQEVIAQNKEEEQRHVAIEEELKRRGELPDVMINPQTGKYRVIDRDGNILVETDKRADALNVAYSTLEENQRIAAEATVQIFDELMATRGTQAEGAVVSQRRQTAQSLVDEGIVSYDQMMQGAMTAAKADGVSEQQAQIDSSTINGFSRAEYWDQVRTMVSRTFATGGVETAIHETVHNRVRRGMANGTYTREMALEWVRAAERALEGKTDKAGKPIKFLPSENDAEIDDRVLEEAVAELAVADTIGRRKSGTRFTPGLIAQGISARLRAEKNAFLGKTKEERAAARKGGNLARFKLFLQGWKETLGNMLRIARQVQAARQEGKLGEDFDAFLDNLLGTDAQSRYDLQTQQEAKQLLEEGKMPFSMSRAKPADASNVIELPDGAQMVGPMFSMGKPSIKTAIEVDGKIHTTAGSHYDATLDYIVRQMPAYQREDMQQAREKAGEILTNEWLKEHNVKQGFVVDGEFMTREETLAKVKELGIPTPLADEEQRNWFDSQDIQEMGPMFSMTPQDREYPAAVEAGDIAKAQALVDEAARVKWQNYQKQKEQAREERAIIVRQAKENEQTAIGSLDWQPGDDPGYWHARTPDRNVLTVRELEDGGFEYYGMVGREEFEGRVDTFQEAVTMAEEEAGIAKQAENYKDESAWEGSMAELVETFVVPPGVHGFTFTGSGQGQLGAYRRSQSLYGEGYYDQSQEDSEENKFRFSVRDHEPTDKWQQVYGYLDKYFLVKKEMPIASVAESIDSAEDWLAKQVQKRQSSDPVTYDESGQVILLSQRFNPETPDPRFSSRSMASVLEAALEAQRRNPEFRERLLKLAVEKAQAIRQDGPMRVNKRGVVSQRQGMDTMADNDRTKSNIEAERKFRRRSRQRELIDAGMAQLTPETLAAYDQGLTTLEDNPLINSMLNDHGKLMSKTAAQKAGKLRTDGKGNAGDYDDAPRLPIAWYSKSGGIMPDVMAENLGFDSVPAFWDALRSAIYSTRTANEAFQKARSAVRQVEVDALAQATKEANEWAAEAEAKVPTPKEKQLAALRTLDAILSIFPPEIRGKVGGMYQLAKANTDAAREKEILKRVEIIDEVLEKEGVKLYRAKIEKLFKRYAPKKEAGKKPVGQLEPDAQELVDAASEAMGYDEIRMRAEVSAIDSMLAEEGLSDERETYLERKRELIQIFADYKNADAARLESAADALEATASEGWAKWKLKKIMERERREEARKSLVADTGKPSIGKERDKQNKWAKTTFGKPFSMLLNISSFSELLRFEFGEKSAEARRLEDQERAAAYAYEDAMQAFGDRIGDFFAELAGGRLAGEQLRFDLAQPTLTVGTGDNERTISQLQGIQALLMWQQEDGRRHMEGQLDESGKPVGSWHYGEEWVKDLESKMTPEAYQVKAFLEQLYSEEYPALNALYRQRHGVNLPKNPLYSPLTVQPMQAKAGEMVDPVSGFAVTGSILTPGGLRTRNKRAVAEPRFEDAVQIFLGHSRQMEHWKAYYDFAMDAQAILLNREVTNAVESKGSKQAVAVLKKWVDQFAQGGSRDAQAGLEISNFYSRASGRAARVALLGRISTILIQSTQLAAASVKMPVGAYLKRLGMLLSGNLNYADAVKSPFIQRRYKTAPPIVQQANAGVGDANRPGALSSTTPRILGNALSGADALFTGGTYAMLLDYHRTVTGPALGLQGAELETFAKAEAERDTEAVAQPVRAGTRSIFENTLTSPLAKTGFAFASEARQKIALAAWAAYKAKSDPTQAAKVAFLTFIVGGLVTQIIKNLWREAKGDDDEKMWSSERLTKATLAGPLHGIPGVSELMGDPGLFSGFKWSAGAVEKIATKAMEDNLDEVTMRDMENALSAAGYFNDTAAGIAGLSHLGFDFAKILQTLAEEE